jgi:hypothetical protein
VEASRIACSGRTSPRRLAFRLGLVTWWRNSGVGDVRVLCHGSQVRIGPEGRPTPDTWPNTGMGRINRQANPATQDMFGWDHSQGMSAPQRTSPILQMSSIITARRTPRHRTCSAQQ